MILSLCGPANAPARPTRAPKEFLAVHKLATRYADHKPEAANAKSLNVTGLNRATTYYFRIRANNGITSSAWVNAVPFPIVTNP